MMQRLSTFSMMAAMVRRDLQSALRRGSEWSNPLLFFVMVCTLFPLGVGPEREQLAALAPGVIWVVALLASMMATDSLFRGDHDDATLEQLLLSPVPLYPLVLAKTLTHWMLSGLPLSLLSPLLGMLLQLPPAGYGVLMLSLLLGSVVLSMIGAIGAALTVGLRRGGLLLSLIVLPLYIPVLIFGSAAVSNAVEGLSYQAPLAILAALLMAALALAPLAIGGALRISVDQ
ncbi:MULTISPECIES: heme exporter protein CcmB [Spongiibacter]|uniref:heme exporter protein CcmB n=1 Tax=Spongiibacter TaxID=630749 RepID=UPI000C68AAFB|nr:MULTISPECIES: heme exporter protein CcmB [Spongiibacter]MAY37586.1 heme exporter protein CcmB [Spongiibacter sp.]MBO6751573.1 heme exporter protein CcmB [Spongiibacter sp.]MBU70692.1 heme exporter protein CcmB [Spongiibacter sp.]|tara:strand:+ start:19569 stop:20258 length:690 start_codon:yes stop_codon:yes gene_type:complete